MGSDAKWMQIVEEKRSLRDKALEPYLVSDMDQRLPRVHNVQDRSCVRDDPVAQEITDIDNVPKLVERLRSGDYTAEQVTRAYIRRAVIAHQLTNAITEAVFEDALRQARQLDSSFKESGKLKGPLHGVPVTVKDQFNVQGTDSTLGYIGRSFRPAEEDALIVRILKELGAVVLLKTNLPQSILWAETENPLWGRTDNPRDPELTPGGSTGGEAALLALHGSIFGLGTDIGGSIRIPGALNGLYALKPSSNRYPAAGVPGSTEGQENAPSSVGPLARDLESLCYVSRLIANSAPWEYDAKCAPLPWDEKVFEDIQTRPLVVGLILDDGVVRIHPPVERALREIAAKLTQDGHEVILWDTSDHHSCVQLMGQYYTADGGEDLRRDISAAGEPMIPHVQALIDRAETKSVYDYWQMNRTKTSMQQAYLAKWNAVRSPRGKQVDVLLGPTVPHTAIRHRALKYAGYTRIWNLLDYPALVIPVDIVRKDIDRRRESGYSPRNALDTWNWDLYDPDTMDGHPVSLQIIGKRFNEEKVLGAATVIERICKVDK
ncbi:amidase [Aspergillus aculeatinus CBS 121060]|uniref:Amidase n=1 Tax=Aspergillus aculeatinus CBS 121060 TaxID=1448322 RepID=A0ACD1GUK4_9EURO|nr:amidase [Aspergillus aculeatinus CBS 121060]RAH64999.1 amidase [Aspergillus aculeatinus CBS 121060]